MIEVHNHPEFAILELVLEGLVKQADLVKAFKKIEALKIHHYSESIYNLQIRVNSEDSNLEGIELKTLQNGLKAVYKINPPQRAVLITDIPLNLDLPEIPQLLLNDTLTLERAGKMAVNYLVFGDTIHLPKEEKAKKSFWSFGKK